MPTPISPIELERLGDLIMGDPRSKAGRARMHDLKLLELSVPENDWERRMLAAHTHRLLNLATADARLDRVRRLLEAGAPVVVHGEADDQEGWTLLHHIVEGEVLDASGSNIHELDRLLEFPAVRAAIDHQTVAGDTALLFAIQAKFDVAALHLLKGGARLDASKTNEQSYKEDPKPVEWELICNHLGSLPKTAQEYAGLLNPEDAQSDDRRAQVLLSRLTYLCKQARSRESKPGVVDEYVELIERILAPLSGQSVGSDERYSAQLLSDAKTTLTCWIAITVNDDLLFNAKGQAAVRMLEAFHGAGLDVWNAQEGGLWSEITTPIGSQPLLAHLEKARLDRATQAPAAPRARSKRL